MTKRSIRSPSSESSRRATGWNRRVFRTRPGPFSKNPTEVLDRGQRRFRLGLLPHNEFGIRFWDAFFGALSLSTCS